LPTITCRRRGAARAIAALPHELRPGEGEAHVDLRGQERGGPARVARASERGVRGDEADGDAAVPGQLLGGLLEERRSRERIARGIQDLRGDLPHERDRPEPAEERRDERPGVPDVAPVDGPAGPPDGDGDAPDVR
jgi:hypothetical protein